MSGKTYVLTKNSFIHCEDNHNRPSLKHSRSRSLNDVSLSDALLTPQLPLYMLEEQYTDPSPTGDEKRGMFRTRLGSSTTFGPDSLTVSNLETGRIVSVSVCNREMMKSGSSTTSFDDVLKEFPSSVEHLQRLYSCSTSSSILGSSSECSSEEERKTTIMIRHIPCRYTKHDILEEVREVGFPFDFLYLPHATRSPGNLGYAFVNFLDPNDAEMFIEVFRGHTWALQPNSTKTADPIYAKLQGFTKNAAFYNNRKIPKSKYRPFVDFSSHMSAKFA